MITNQIYLIIILYKKYIFDMFLLIRYLANKCIIIFYVNTIKFTLTIKLRLKEYIYI